jgi:uncharacterized protein with von Willebrand factor type A (vWA) domain
MSELRPDNADLAALQCRDDTLQAMYWMRGEGLGDEVDARQLASFLVVEPDLLAEQLDILVQTGLLIESEGRYRLSEDGIREGGRRFHDEFSDLQKSAHGDCGPNCPYCRGIRGKDCPHCAMVA